MKKFLCVLLTIAMLLSSMVFVVSAAEETGNTEVIWLADCDTIAGNKGIEKYAGIDTEDKTQGAGSLKTKHPAGSYNPGGFIWQYGFDTPVDVSKANYFSFDFYISDASVLSGKLQLELTSSGQPDVEEGMYPGITLKDGWNTLQIPLAFFPGGCDFTRFNFMRLFNAHTVSASEEVLCKIDNIRFECGDKISFNAFSDNDSYFLMATTHVGQASWGKFADKTGKIIFAFELPADKCAYIESVKVATTLNGPQPALLVSSNCSDWTTVFSANGADGARVVYEDITDAINFDKSNYVYIAVADSDTSNGSGGQMHNGRQFDLMIDYSEAQVRADAEYYTFRVRTDSEENYLVSTNGTDHRSAPFRYHDKTKTSVWKYTLSNATDVQNIYWSARIAGSDGCLIQVSIDGKNYTNVYSGVADSNNPYTFSLLPFIDLDALQNSPEPTIYIRIGDSTPANGSGGQIFSTYYTTLTVLHNPPPVTGLIAVVQKTFSAYTLLSRLPFFARLFAAAEAN